MYAIKFAIRITLLLIVIVSLQSCKDEYTICDLPTDVALKVRFYEKYAGGERQATATSFSLKQVGRTDYIYRNSPNVTNFSLPLDPLLDSARFVLSVSATAPADTVTFVYTSQSINLSPACGNIYTNTLSRASTTVYTLDSARIISNLVNTSPADNIKIYF